MKKDNPQKGEIIIYKTSKNEVELKVHFEKESVWLSQNEVAMLFGWFNLRGQTPKSTFRNYAFR